MKKLLITLTAVLASLNLFAQGQTQGYVDFRNSAVAANTSQRIYVNTYGGGSANYAGAGYQVGLYWAPDGTADESMFTMIGAGANVGTGIFQGGSRTIPTTTGNAMFQVRGWTTAYGTDYESGLARGDVSGGLNKVGKSAVFRATGIKDPNAIPTPLADPITTYGVVGFALTPVPEPSAIALGLLGAGTLLLLRRRK
jgi:hypothetical protein